MNTDEKIDAIVAKCRDNITLAEGMIPRAAGVYLADLKYSLAGWTSTIAAITHFRPIAKLSTGQKASAEQCSAVIRAMDALDAIIAAWEGVA